MLQLIITISLICTGAFVSTRRDMLLYPLRVAYVKYIYRTRHERPALSRALAYLSNVLFDCLYCMASFWSILCVLVFDWTLILYIPLIIFAVCGMNAVFAKAVFGSDV